MSGAEFFRGAWRWTPSIVLPCCVLLAAYVCATGLRSLSRAAAWFAGVLLIVLATVSPVQELGSRYLFSVHMATHILFVLVIPALLLLGLPEQRSASHRRPGRLERLLSQPAFTWIAGVGAMAFWHVPVIFNAALSSEALHMLETVSLLICGGIFWWPILAPRQRARLRPVPEAAAYLFTACLACTMIGITITFANRLLYPAFAHPADPYGILPLIRNRWGISPAMDQQIGGILMWVPCCLVYLIAIMAMFARWYREEPATRIETQWI